jgi:hypothetical protein
MSAKINTVKASLTGYNASITAEGKFLLCGCVYCPVIKYNFYSCGHIYCNTHSGNRLPLFTKDASADKPTFSRVCDHCFFSLAGDALESL